MEKLKNTQTGCLFFIFQSINQIVEQYFDINLVIPFLKQ